MMDKQGGRSSAWIRDANPYNEQYFQLSAKNKDEGEYSCVIQEEGVETERYSKFLAVNGAYVKLSTPSPSSPSPPSPSPLPPLPPPPPPTPALLNYRYHRSCYFFPLLSIFLGFF